MTVADLTLRDADDASKLCLVVVAPNPNNPRCCREFSFATFAIGPRASPRLATPPTVAASEDEEEEERDTRALLRVVSVAVVGCEVPTIGFDGCDGGGGRERTGEDRLERFLTFRIVPSSFFFVGDREGPDSVGNVGDADGRLSSNGTSM